MMEEGMPVFQMLTLMAKSGRKIRKRGLRLRPILILRYSVVGVAALVALFPLYWMFVTSLLSTRSVFDTVPHALPDWQWTNYLRAWSLASWGQYFANSILVALSVVALSLLTSLLAGYAFGTMKFPGRQALFMAMLLLIMVPGEAKLIPDYLIVSALGWIDTYQAQIVPFGVSISGIFLLRQFFLSLPPSLWEAAQIDGCSRFRFLWSVAAPLARPALAVIALQVFIASWNAFLWPYLVASSDALRPIEVGLQVFTTVDGNDPSGLAAAASFATLPVLIFFLIVQRQFIEGLTVGSTKG